MLGEKSKMLGINPAHNSHVKLTNGCLVFASKCSSMFLSAKVSAPSECKPHPPALRHLIFNSQNSHKTLSGIPGWPAFLDFFEELRNSIVLVKKHLYAKMDVQLP